MTCAPHPYEGRLASRVVTCRSAGTFFVCLACAEHLHAAGYVTADRPISDVTGEAKTCQCEHASHFEGWRYCGPCDAWTSHAECEACGADTDKAIKARGGFATPDG